jgi:structural maintenance of chromosomes protein 5
MSAKNWSVRWAFDPMGFPLLLNYRHQIALVNLILPFMEYMEAKKHYTEAKTKQRALHKRVQSLQQKNQPMHDFKKRLETRLKRLNEQRDGKKEAAKRRFRAMKSKWDENENLVRYCLSH